MCVGVRCEDLTCCGGFRLFRYILLLVVENRSKMPRSFLVKKHFNSAKKPNYSELDCPAGKQNPAELQHRLSELLLELLSQSSTSSLKHTHTHARARASHVICQDQI